MSHHPQVVNENWCSRVLVSCQCNEGRKGKRGAPALGWRRLWIDQRTDGGRWVGEAAPGGTDGRTDGRLDGWDGRRSTMNGSLTRMPERAISRSVPSSLSSSASWLLGAFRVRADSLRTELNSELTFDPRCLSESTQPYSLPDVDTSPAPPRPSSLSHK